MIPVLERTDLLKHSPDAFDIDLWSESFTWDMIPAEYGCYAFYDSNSIVYIGSATASNPDPAQRGLRMRLRFYRGRGKKERISNTIKKVRDYNNNRKLLLKCWVAMTAGDAKKYEEDALEKYKPCLNYIGTIRQNIATRQKLRREWAKNTVNRYRQFEYQPDLLKRCTKCNVIKRCSEFQRNRNKRLGVKPNCKQCMNKPMKT